MNLHDRDIKKQAFEDGISQGELKKAIETARNLLNMSLSIQDIAKATGLSVEEIEQISGNKI